MKFYKLDPEVAGGWGPNTEFTRTPGNPVVVHKLHYQFDGWLGDDLLESSPCFIITQRLAEELDKHHFSGYELRAVEISTSEQFREVSPDQPLPEFAWLNITSTAGSNDFGLDKDGRLVVSENAFGVLNKMHLDNCDVSEFT